MELRELRKILKGIPGHADVFTGNNSYYSKVNESKHILNIDMQTGSYVKKENSKVTEVILWFDE